VKAALERSRIFENADPGWKSVMKAHYGAIARGEYAAASAEARMMRFSKAPGMRNMSTLGCMDEIRHGQMQLYFPTSTWRRTARWTGPSRPTTPTSGR
jgi:toluene monooxygenase system protein A